MPAFKKVAQYTLFQISTVGARTELQQVSRWTCLYSSDSQPQKVHKCFSRVWVQQLKATAKRFWILQLCFEDNRLQHRLPWFVYPHHRQRKRDRECVTTVVLEIELPNPGESPESWK